MEFQLKGDPIEKISTLKLIFMYNTHTQNQDDWSNGLPVRALTDRRTDGTDSITSTADAVGNKVCFCGVHALEQVRTFSPSTTVNSKRKFSYG